MRRRAYLASGLALLGGLAGCTTERRVTQGGGGRGARSTSTPTPTREPGEGDGPTQTAADEGRFPVARGELKRGAGKDRIPAIVDPVFAEDWSGLDVEVQSSFGGRNSIEPRLGAVDTVIGVERDGEARAYPLRVLNWHEVVNDALGGPLLVTYCPLCRTGLAAVREVEGRETTFGVSGLLWRSNLVMYDDRTGSLWSQVAATAIRGEQAGTSLELVPSTITSWAEWQDAHDDATVLVPPPESSTVVGDDAVRNYNRDPYARYDNSDDVGLDRSEYDDRLHPKTLVLGVSDAEAARAYPLPALQDARLVNDRVGELPVVVTVDGSGSLVAYSRLVDGETLRFDTAAAGTMVGGGSTWRRSTGRAIDGPHEGTSLERANDRPPMFWFSWADIFPGTDIFGE
jgi:hypothetical protein